MIKVEIYPLGDPTAITTAQSFMLEVLLGGKVTNTDMTLFREAGFYGGKKVAADLHTDASGKFTFTRPDAGRYLLLVRHRDMAPSGAAAGYYSYSVTLALEAMQLANVSSINFALALAREKRSRQSAPSSDVRPNLNICAASMLSDCDKGQLPSSNLSLHAARKERSIAQPRH
ncbi:DUF4198 domain-containing protein [Sphingobium yanoikuyae]|uniref:DUF4198 domain-containing protein n=1 Tax=Sphingobium yanoikuyae TaxID=13690 RepID=UPI00311947B0